MEYSRIEAMVRGESAASLKVKLDALKSETRPDKATRGRTTHLPRGVQKAVRFTKMALERALLREASIAAKVKLARGGGNGVSASREEREEKPSRGVDAGAEQSRFAQDRVAESAAAEDRSMEALLDEEYEYDGVEITCKWSREKRCYVLTITEQATHQNIVLPLTKNHMEADWVYSAAMDELDATTSDHPRIENIAEAAKRKMEESGMPVLAGTESADRVVNFSTERFIGSYRVGCSSVSNGSGFKLTVYNFGATRETWNFVGTVQNAEKAVTDVCDALRTGQFAFDAIQYARRRLSAG